MILSSLLITVVTSISSQAHCTACKTFSVMTTTRNTTLVSSKMTAIKEKLDKKGIKYTVADNGKSLLVTNSSPEIFEGLRNTLHYLDDEIAMCHERIAKAHDTTTGPTAPGTDAH